MVLLKYALCDSKKLQFIKEQQTSGLLIGLEIRTGLDEITLLGLILY